MVTGLVQPAKRDAKVNVSHLMFADDILIFCHADKNSLHDVSTLLEDLDIQYLPLC